MNSQIVLTAEDRYNDITEGDTWDMYYFKPSKAADMDLFTFSGTLDGVFEIRGQFVKSSGKIIYRSNSDGVITNYKSKHFSGFLGDEFIYS